MNTLQATRDLVRDLQNPDSLPYMALAYAIVGDDARSEAIRSFSRKLSQSRVTHRDATLA